MRRFALLSVVVFALLAAIPAISLGKGGPPIGTEDSCAASFGVEDASACGGSWPRQIGCWSYYNSGGYWEGYHQMDGGPGASPRYWTSWWVSGSNLC